MNSQTFETRDEIERQHSAGKLKGDDYIDAHNAWDDENIECYCENCSNEIIKGDEQFLDGNGNTHCSQECADEANFEIGCQHGFIEDDKEDI